MQMEISVILVVFFLFPKLLTAQELGSKVYKEISYNGKEIEGWMIFFGFNEYDEKGNLFHEKLHTGKEELHEYDSMGHIIYDFYKDVDSCKTSSYEYDSEGRKVYQIDNKVDESWFEYEFYSNGSVKIQKEFIFVR